MKPSDGRLHLLLSPEALADCRSQLLAGDRLVLLDRGVGLLADPEALADLGERASLNASVEDRRARGLPAQPAAPDVDDAGVVALVERHRHVLSWS